MSDLSEKRDENGWIKGSTVGCYTTVIADSDSSGTYLPVLAVADWPIRRQGSTPPNIRHVLISVT